MRHGEKRVGRAARAELHQRVRLHAARGVVDRAKETGERFDRLFWALVVVRGIVAGRNGVHVLAIELKAVESPLAQNLPHQRFMVFDHALVGRTQVKRIPPGNLALRSIAIQQKIVGMAFQQL